MNTCHPHEIEISCKCGITHLIQLEPNEALPDVIACPWCGEIVAEGK